jgi:sigma-E factor negative regulatory protein RseA
MVCKMTNQIHKKLSQYLDGDLEKAEALELLTLMQADPELQQKLRRYLIVQQALKTTPVATANTDFLSKVKQGIEHEPVYLLPRQAPIKPVRKATILALAAALGAFAVIVPIWKKAAPNSPAEQVYLSQQQPTADFDKLQRVRTFPVNQRFHNYLQAHNGSLYTNGTAIYQAQARLASIGQE